MLQKYIPFVGLCLGFFIVMMDATTVPLTYTTLMNVFHVGPATVAWVNNSYLITFAACLLLGGKLGDTTNRKFIVLIAYFILSIGAAISGAGQSFATVVFGRVLMGIGAGLFTPQSMAYISILFAKGGRGTALGIWGAVAGIACSTGPVITQIFLAAGNWRWVMWVNIPVALVCFLIAAKSLPNENSRAFKLKDTLMISLYGLCVAAAIIGIQFMSESGAMMIVGIATFFIGMLAALSMMKNDLKKKHGHILSPTLWQDREFLRFSLISGLLGAGLTAFYFPLVFLLSVRMAFGPIAISSVMVTVALSNMLVGPIAGNLSDKLQPEKIVRLGLILFSAANAALGLIGILVPGGRVALVALCLAMIAAGSGTGLAFAPLANLALGRARVANVGQAMAFFNAARQVFSALGGVIIAFLFSVVVRLQLGRYFQVTLTSLRESPQLTAIAALACFLLIAFSLAVAAYLSRSEKELVTEFDEKAYKEGLKT